MHFASSLEHKRRFVQRRGRRPWPAPAQTVEGHLRAIIGTLTVEEIYRNRDQFAASVQAD